MVRPMTACLDTEKSAQTFYACGRPLSSAARTTAGGAPNDCLIPYCQKNGEIFELV